MTGEESPDRNKDELRELMGRSDSRELGEPGGDASSSCRGRGEVGGEGSDAMERGEVGSGDISTSVLVDPSEGMEKREDIPEHRID
jgi:hypothetical protein